MFLIMPYSLVLQALKSYKDPSSKFKGRDSNDVTSGPYDKNIGQRLSKKCQ